MTDQHTPLTDQQLDQLDRFLHGPLGERIVIDHGTATRLLATARALTARVAELEQELPTCGRSWSVDGDEYPPCARPEGHPEAYCRSADGQSYFLAAAEEAHVVADDSDDPEHVDDCLAAATPAVSGAADSRQP